MPHAWTRWFPGGGCLGSADWAVVIGAACAMAGASSWAGRAREAEHFQLAGRRLPWWLCAASLLATEITIVTMVGLTGTAFRGDWGFIQFLIGSVAARLWLALRWAPALQRARCATPYEFLARRVGGKSRVLAAAASVAVRLLASSLRLATAAAVLGALAGCRPDVALAALAMLSLSYSLYAGFLGAVYAGAVQAAVVVAAGGMALAFAARHVTGGADSLWRLSELRAFDWGGASSLAGVLRRFFSDPDVFWSALLSGFFGSLAAFGMDHEMAQKFLAARDERDCRRAMLLSLLLGALVSALFLAAGSSLGVFYRMHPGLSTPTEADQALPHFVATVLPRFWRGLAVAAVALASIDLPLVSLSAVFLNDLFPGPRRWTEKATAARVAIALIAVALLALTFRVERRPALAGLAFQAGAAVYGPLVGVFVLAYWGKPASDRITVLTMAAAILGGAGLLLLSQSGTFPLSAGWIMALGAAAVLAARRA